MTIKLAELERGLADLRLDGWLEGRAPVRGATPERVTVLTVAELATLLRIARAAHAIRVRRPKGVPLDVLRDELDEALEGVQP